MNIISSAPPVEDGSTDDNPPKEDEFPCLQEETKPKAMSMKKM